MSSLKRLYLFFVSILFTISSFSQWTQTAGPIGGPTEEIFKIGNSIVLATRWGGVYKSIDEGESWNPSNSGFPNNPRIYDMFEADGTLYASIEYKGIYISTDQGDSWASISPMQENETSYYIFVEGNNIYGGLNRSGELLYSPDKGVTWQIKKSNAPGNQFVNLHVHNSKLYAKRSNKLYETQDHGDTWVEIVVPGLGANGLSSMATHNDMLFVADEYSVFYSQDAITWTDANIPSPAAGMTLQSHEGTLYANTRMGTYYYLSEIGQSWTQVQKPNTEGHVKNLLFLDDDIIMSAADGIHKSADDGLTWSAKNNGINAQSSYEMVYNDNYVFATGGGGIYRSDDNGENWTTVNNGFFRPGFFQNIPDIVSVDNTLFASTFGGVYSSIDNGDSWVPKYFASTSLKYMGHLAFDNGVLVTTESGTGVLLSTDLGETWTLASTEGLNTSSQFISILVHENIIVVGNYNRELFLSTDMGQSWNDISIPGQFGNQRPIDLEYQSDRLYVTTTQGLSISDNLGTQWQPFIENDSQYMWDVEIIDDAIYVATFNGVQVSKEGRNSWYPLTEGMGAKRIIKLLVRDDVIFSATEAYGIWVGPISELGVPPLDDDNDGIANDNDLCPNTAQGISVNDNGCDLIASNAISVYASTPSCPNVDNGTIEIATSLAGYTFDIQIIGEGRDENFTAINLDPNFKVDDLASGIYEITVAIPDILHEQVFGVTIDELDDISGKFQGVDPKSESARYIVSGSTEYTVNINGIQKGFSFDSTNNNEIVLYNLKTSNEVLITGKNDCQGKVNDTFSYKEEILIYPTITSGLLNIDNGFEAFEIRVFNSSGQLVLEDKNNIKREGSINLDNCTAGLYIVHVLSEGDTKTFKIIKR